MRIALLFLVGCMHQPGGFSDVPPDVGAPATGFATPQAVAINGYTQSAMEPFITRDGAYLLFNNSNDKSVNTNLQLAKRVDDVTFDYVGEITGANSDQLDGVATVAGNTLYFVSTRSYSDSLSTIYTADFTDGVATNPTIVDSISRHEPLIVNFDVEVSADGNDLYFVDALFSQDGIPQQADLVLATKVNGTFVRQPATILANVNSSSLEYAAGISADELELFFTRVDAITADAMPTIYRATRASKSDPFGVPEHVDAATGFVEGATVAPDNAIYYHHCEGSPQFCTIYHAARTAQSVRPTGAEAL
ncbi:MAG: hypothetical protein QM831_13385 [Kofleriaceae bacterium]